MNNQDFFQNGEQMLQFHVDDEIIVSQSSSFQNHFSSHFSNATSNQRYAIQIQSEISYAEAQNNQQLIKLNEKKAIGFVKGAWTKDEDKVLSDTVAKFGPERWVLIAKELGSRTGKQCRERWHNHLDPSKDVIIWDMFNSMGPKWAYMAKELRGRPDNAIKNHFNTFLRPRRSLKKKEADLKNNCLTYPSTEIKVADNFKTNYFSQQNLPIVQQKLLKKPKRGPKISKKKLCVFEEPSTFDNAQNQPAYNNYFSHCFDNPSVNTVINPDPFYSVSKHPLHSYYASDFQRHFFNHYYPDLISLSASMPFNPMNLSSFVPSDLTSPLINNSLEGNSDNEVIRQLGQDLGVDMDHYS